MSDATNYTALARLIPAALRRRLARRAAARRAAEARLLLRGLPAQIRRDIGLEA
jgi:hypothetical protein